MSISEQGCVILTALDSAIQSDSQTVHIKFSKAKFGSSYPN